VRKSTSRVHPIFLHEVIARQQRERAANNLTYAQVVARNVAPVERATLAEAAVVAAGFRLDLDAARPSAEDIEAANAAAAVEGRAVATDSSLDVLVVDEDGNLRRALAVAAALRRRGFATDIDTCAKPLARAAATGVPWLAQVYDDGAIQLADVSSARPPVVCDDVSAAADALSKLVKTSDDVEVAVRAGIAAGAGIAHAPSA